MADKTNTELALEAAQASVTALAAKVAAETAAAQNIGVEEKKLALYLHDEMCPRCAGLGAGRGSCALFTSVSSHSLTDAPWTEEAYVYWLKAATKLVTSLPALGWTIS